MVKPIRKTSHWLCCGAIIPDLHGLQQAVSSAALTEETKKTNIVPMSKGGDFNVTPPPVEP